MIQKHYAANFDFNATAFVNTVHACINEACGVTVDLLPGFLSPINQNKDIMAMRFTRDDVGEDRTPCYHFGGLKVEI